MQPPQTCAGGPLPGRERQHFIPNVPVRKKTPHPVFDGLGGVGGLLPGVVLCQHVNEPHEVHLSLGRPWKTPTSMPDRSEGLLGPVYRYSHSVVFCTFNSHSKVTYKVTL